MSFVQKMKIVSTKKIMKYKAKILKLRKMKTFKTFQMLLSFRGKITNLYILVVHLFLDKNKMQRQFSEVLNGTQDLSQGKVLVEVLHK